MAPATTSKPLQQMQNRPRQRMVVPVIPLPYVQKRQQQEAARAKAKEEAAAPPPVLEDVRTPTPPSPTVEEITPPIANGSTDEQVPDKAEETIEPELPSVPDTSVVAAVEEEAAVAESEPSAPVAAHGKQTAHTGIFIQDRS